MTRKTFLSSLLLTPILTTISAASNSVPYAPIPSSPLPNISKFYIEIRIDPNTAHFVYFIPSKLTCRQWLASFVTPILKVKQSFHGYYYYDSILDDDFWNNEKIFTKTYAHIPLLHRYPIQIHKTTFNRVDSIQFLAFFTNSSLTPHASPSDIQTYWSHVKNEFLPMPKLS